MDPLARQEFKRSWLVWVVMFISGGMKFLVNQVEVPFARSLVVCQEPMQPGVYTGSAHCGDRLQVIGEGLAISSVGQAQESAAMLFSIALVAIGSSVFGRKPVMLLGLASTTVSVVLFLVACGSPEIGKRLFAMGQGLQGLYCCDFLFSIMLVDLSLQEGANAMACYSMGYTLEWVSKAVWKAALGSSVQLMQLTDYTFVWSAVLLVNASMLCLVAASMPETRAKAAFAGETSAAADAGESKKADADGDGVLASLKSATTRIVLEVASYKELFADFRARRTVMRLLFEFFTHDTYFRGFLYAQLMAYHGWSQPSVTGIEFFLEPLGVLCQPLLELTCKKYGYHAVFLTSFAFKFLLENAVNLTLPLSWTAPIVLYTASFALSGFTPLKYFVMCRFCERSVLEKFVNMHWILGYGMGIFVGPFYVSLFDAHAVTYFARAKVGFAMLAAWVGFITCCSKWFPYNVYDMGGTAGGFGVSLREIDQFRAVIDRLWNASNVGGFVDETVFKAAGIEATLGRDFASIKRPKGLRSMDEMTQALAPASRAERWELLERLEKAIVAAEKWRSSEDGAAAIASAASSDGKKQA